MSRKRFDDDEDFYEPRNKKKTKKGRTGLGEQFASINENTEDVFENTNTVTFGRFCSNDQRKNKTFVQPAPAPKKVETPRYTPQSNKTPIPANILRVNNRDIDLTTAKGIFKQPDELSLLIKYNDGSEEVISFKDKNFTTKMFYRALGFIKNQKRINKERK